MPKKSQKSRFGSVLNGVYVPEYLTAFLVVASPAKERVICAALAELVQI